MALEIGYDGVQMLPIRGATGNETDVLLYEDAWNAVPGLWHALKHWDGASNMPSNWRDWLVSPTPEICNTICDTLRIRGIQRIDHGFGIKTSWVELNPDIVAVSLTGTDLLCHDHGYRLVIDTHHLRRPRRDDEAGQNTSPLLDDRGNWRLAIELLAPYVRAIHVNTTGEETDSDRDATNAILCHTLLCTRRADVDELIVVAEYPPTPETLLSPRTCKETAVAMLKRIRSFTEPDH